MTYSKIKFQMDGTPKSQWEYIYQTIPVEQIPWETGEPSPDLVRLFVEKSIRKGTKVLDVGCGLGTQTRFMAQRGATPTGIDISQTAISKAREQLLSEKDTIANFIVGDVCKMPMPTGAFEFIYDRGCYHHLSVQQRREYVKEVSRVLAPQGLLHMLIFAGAMGSFEVIEYFLQKFQVVLAYEDTVVDHTNNNQQIPIHILQFRKIA